MNFAKISVHRQGDMFQIKVLAAVRCTRMDCPVRTEHDLHKDDGVCLRLPGLSEMVDGSTVVRKVRLSTLGYDRCDKVVAA